MADFMFQNMTYRATVYRTGVFTLIESVVFILHFLESHVSKPLDCMIKNTKLREVLMTFLFLETLSVLVSLVFRSELETHFSHPGP